MPNNDIEIGFVCEASPQVGGGHFMRCMTLAGVMHRDGANVRFAVNEEAQSVIPPSAKAAFPITIVSTFENAEIWPDQLDAIVFDSYSIDSKLEVRFRQKAAKLMVIDDLANRAHDCDLLLDSSSCRTVSDYTDGLLPRNTRVLVGPDYALLRPEFTAMRPQSLASRVQSRPVERLLISLGLTDVGGITERVVSTMLATNLQVQIDVVIGPLAESREKLERLARVDRRLKLHVSPQSMAALMTNADLSIGAGGSTSWERCCLGVPSIILVLADNQRQIASSLKQLGAAKAVDCGDVDFLRQISAAVESLIESDVARLKMSEAAAAVVDGNGACRAWAVLRGMLEQASKN